MIQVYLSDEGLQAIVDTATRLAIDETDHNWVIEVSLSSATFGMASDGPLSGHLVGEGVIKIIVGDDRVVMARWTYYPDGKIAITEKKVFSPDETVPSPKRVE